MKKQLTILLLSFFSCTCNYAQTWIKLTSPCNVEFLKNVPGEWIHRGDPWYAKVSKQQEQEIRKRVTTIHQFLFNLLPTIHGFDAAWGIHSSDYEFAPQSTREQVTADQSRQKFFNGIPLVQYTYSVKFCEYSCGRAGVANEMRKGYPREEGAVVSISANTLNQFLLRDYGGTEGMQIDGRNIKMMPPAKSKWKGYTLYDGDDGDMVLLHRNGMLPYIPVTRKQYLELCISYFTIFYDNEIAEYVKLTTLMGMKPDLSYKEETEKQKKNVLKYYQDELTATTNAGLLDTPAIVLIYLNPSSNYSIFVSETEGGHMLVTESPSYFRKDLPNYIPQLFLLRYYGCSVWQFTPKEDPMGVFEEKFPIEKLQAMIDK